jgi:hypothetical protein
VVAARRGSPHRKGDQEIKDSRYGVLARPGGWGIFGLLRDHKLRNDEALGEPIFTLENEMEVTAGDLDFDSEEFTSGMRRPLDDREISISWEQAKAEGDKLLAGRSRFGFWKGLNLSLPAGKNVVARNGKYL